jgi:hypothetical protein
MFQLLYIKKTRGHLPRPLDMETKSQNRKRYDGLNGCAFFVNSTSIFEWQLSNECTLVINGTLESPSVPRHMFYVCKQLCYRCSELASISMQDLKRVWKDRPSGITACNNNVQSAMLAGQRNPMP